MLSSGPQDLAEAERVWLTLKEIVQNTLAEKDMGNNP